jgi:hypothetical protein
MILYVANLLCTDHEPIAMATRFSSAEARALLLHTKDASLVQEERWSDTSLGGTDFCQGDQDPGGVGIYARIHALAGISLSIAPVAGLGYWHEAGTAGDHWRDVQRRAANERDLVVEVAKRCRDVHTLPVVAVTDSVNLRKEEFEVSFRRRVAYALGFHASLRAGSLECYEARYEPLIVGTAAQLGQVASGHPASHPLADQLDGFSLLLNLLSRLHGTLAYERHHDAPAPRAPGKVLFYRDKVALLEGKIAEVSRGLKRALNVDGHSALRSLLLQLRSERDGGFWNVDSSPIWGMAQWPTTIYAPLP